MSNTNISKLPAECGRLQTLDCSGCNLLTLLPEGLSSLTTFDCDECEGLKQLPAELSPNCLVLGFTRTRDI